MPLFKGLSRAKESGQEFNIAVEHSQRLRTLARGDPRRISEALEVIRHCQVAISLDPRNGDAYVLLANGLGVGAQELLESGASTSRTDTLQAWGAAALQRCRSLQGLHTKNRQQADQLYEMFLAAVQRRERCSRKEAEEYMTQQEAKFGSLVTAPASYDSITEVLTQETAQHSPARAVTSVLFEKLELELENEGIFLDEAKRRLLHKWAGALGGETEVSWVEAFAPEMVRLLRRRYEAENCPEELWGRYVAADFVRTGHMSFLDTAALLAMGRGVTELSWLDKYL